MYLKLMRVMYGRNPLGKKTRKPLPVCWYALYRIDVSLRKVPNSFVLILPAPCVSQHVGGRWENPEALTSASLCVSMFVFLDSQI
jgi:hypothetical protein